MSGSELNLRLLCISLMERVISTYHRVLTNENEKAHINMIITFMFVMTLSIKVKVNQTSRFLTSSFFVSSEVHVSTNQYLFTYNQMLLLGNLLNSIENIYCQY